MRIATEASKCREAFEGVEVGAIVQHCHHERWLERLTEPAENRITFILENKAKDEQAERLRRFRPLADADWQKADADWQKAYADWQKADADKQKAYADKQKADADKQKADVSPAMIALHAEICGCAWSATTDIFGNSR